MADTLPQSAHRRELGAAHAAPVKLMPYVTVGLTRDEVIAIEGAPTAAAADSKLVYQGSEIDFTAGKVSGWKIDPASAPIRVKLWPDAPVDPDLDSFGVGSSKNVVLVVQGTPTYFSENEFGYGGSEVYFQNGRVVSWKDDPAGGRCGLRHADQKACPYLRFAVGHGKSHDLQALRQLLGKAITRPAARG